MKPDTDIAFPHLPIEQFDRYAHQLDGLLDAHWAPEVFPFNHLSLPRLPEIKNPEYALQARTHRSIPARIDPDGDPELECLNFFETVGDGLLQGQVTRALVASGCNVADDLTVLRSKLVCNSTLSHVAWAYRLHHGYRHTQQMKSPHQKLMGDLFEAYIGAAWMDARERGTEREVDDFLLEFFKPAHWPQWQPMLQEMLRTGPQKRQGKVAQYRLNKAKRQREAAVKEAAKVAGVKAAVETVQGSLGRTNA
ncbi:hypothetical protein EHS25_007061 [Saitozyma podzolica]|uniref:RNase III domain-containing protein n=1 Tax=Saitozyma podzolica TaxID=1890683 RepID=A0A427XPG9_9TREE|nr:hypothetical protein EHS25_007061 [Saitozyma podzolica]